MTAIRAALDYLWFHTDDRKRPVIRYEPDLRRLPLKLVDRFHLLDSDSGTQHWLQSATRPSVAKGVVAELLRMVFSRTTANGIAGRGGMFVFSKQQFLSLVQGNPPSEVVEGPPLWNRLLDIGAGDGGVTSHIAPLFRVVDATEDSFAMRFRLKQRGYQVLPVNAPLERGHYDVIACLNVLDRADRPLSLLRDVKHALKPDGLLILAVVLPWCPFVENGGGQKTPSELLPMTGGECCKGATFEASLERLVTNVLEPAGFELVRWTKLPYLCEGSPTHAFYKLDDAVMVLRISSEREK